jgi:hypothetical protein
MPALRPDPTFTGSIWETHSNGRQQAVLSIGCLAAGLLLVALLNNAPPDDSNAQAGFWFGVVLLAIGGATLIAHARQRVVVDPQLREIRIEDWRLLGRQLRCIPFAEVQSVQVAYLRTRTNIAIRYFLQLQLQHGEPYALFAPARVYPGAGDPQIVAGWQSRLSAYLAAPAP